MQGVYRKITNSCWIFVRSWANIYGVLAICLLGGAFAIHCMVLGRAELCVFRSLCGLPCPGCGLCHAFEALFFHGDIVKSLHYHALFLPILFDIFMLCIPTGIHPVFMRYRQCAFWHWFFLAVYLGYYIFRMVAIFPSDQYPMIYVEPNYCQMIFDLIQDIFS